MIVKKKEGIPSGWNGMRKCMEAGVSKLYVGDGQADKLGWTSLTTLGHIKSYSHLLLPLLPRIYSLGLSLDIPYLQPSFARCPPLSSNSTLSSTIINILYCGGHWTSSSLRTKTMSCLLMPGLGSFLAFSRYLVKICGR